MGCHDKTQSEVKGDLERELIAAAKRKVDKDYPNHTKSTGDSLEEHVHALALARFQDKAGYTFSSSCQPPKSKGNVVTLSRLGSLDDDKDRDTLIRQFVDSRLLSGANLPLWMKNNTRADLLSITKDLTNMPYRNDWQYSEYMQSYDGAGVKQKSKKCDAVIIYANGTLAEDGLRASIHIFYFLAVYYDMDSPAVEARDELEQNAWASAGRLVQGSRITNEQEFEATLKTHATALFKNHFKYDYTSDPPDYPSNKQATMLARNWHLCYSQDRSAKNVDSYVEHEIFAGLNITIPQIRSKVLTALQSQFKEVYKEDPVKMWNSINLDQSYELQSSTFAPGRAAAVLVYWYDYKTISHNEGGRNVDIQVDVTYIAFLGLVYELTPDPIGQDLLKELAVNLTGRSTDGMKSWTDEIDSAAKASFQENFKFEFGTDPPDRKNGTGLKCLSHLFEFSTLPEPEVVQEKIDHELFKRSDTGFAHNGPEIYDNLLDALNYRSGSQTVKDINIWKHGFMTPTYHFQASNNTTRTIKEYAAYLFVHGKLTEDGRGGSTAEKFYIHWLGAFCQIDTPNDDDDVLF